MDITPEDHVVSVLFLLAHLFCFGAWPERIAAVVAAWFLKGFIRYNQVSTVLKRCVI